MLQTCLLVAGMKTVNNEMVFELVFLVLGVDFVFWFWVGGLLDHSFSDTDFADFSMSIHIQSMLQCSKHVSWSQR